MERNKFIEKDKEIIQLIKTTVVSRHKNLFPIYDGVIDIEKYISAKFKILWILKEPYDDFDKNGKPTGGDWHMREAIIPKTKLLEFKGGRNTFEPMIYSTWSILNNFPEWNEMTEIEKAPQMIDSIKSIGYINVKKIPGKTASSSTVISNNYNKFKDLLLKQIEYLDPNIIIGGSTLHLFLKDLGVDTKSVNKTKEINYYYHNGKLLIDAYHPAQRTGNTGVTKEMYCNSIINAVKEWANIK